MTGRREEARAPGWGWGREWGWLWTLAVCWFCGAMAWFAALGALVMVLMGLWGEAGLLVLMVPCWLLAAGGVAFGGAWVWRPELLGGRRWPQVWRRVLR